MLLHLTDAAELRPPRTSDAFSVGRDDRELPEESATPRRPRPEAPGAAPGSMGARPVNAPSRFALLRREVMPGSPL